MQTPRPDVLPTFQKNNVEATLRQLIEDTDIAVTITYLRLQSQTMDVEAGLPTRTEDSDSLSALFHDVTVDEVERSGGKLQMGDRIYQFMVDDITLVPTTSDRITQGSVTREVVDWEKDTFALSYLITARGGGAQ